MTSAPLIRALDAFRCKFFAVVDLSNGCVRGFPKRDSASQAVPIHQEFPGHLRNGHHHALVGVFFAAAIIVALFYRSGPSAVLLAIVTIVVLSVQAHAVRTAPHILQEGGEILPPLVTHRDATAAVARVVLVTRIEAPILGHLPDRVLARHNALAVGGISPFRFAVFGGWHGW